LLRVVSIGKVRLDVALGADILVGMPFAMLRSAPTISALNVPVCSLVLGSAVSAGGAMT
jgi:hypothetical protein